MSMEGTAALKLSPGFGIRAEYPDSRLGRDGFHRRSAKAAGIAGDDEGASGPVGGGRRDAIFEIRAETLQRFKDHSRIDGGHFKHLKQRMDRVLRLHAVSLLGEQIVESCHRMRGKVSLGVMPLNGCPQRFTRFGVRLSRQDHIQENVRVEKDARHRYLAVRTLRYSSR